MSCWADSNVANSASAAQSTNTFTHAACRQLSVEGETNFIQMSMGEREKSKTKNKNFAAMFVDFRNVCGVSWALGVRVRNNWGSGPMNELAAKKKSQILWIAFRTSQTSCTYYVVRMTHLWYHLHDGMLYKYIVATMERAGLTRSARNLTESICER